MTIKQITDALESIAPRPYQESYDNAGLIAGDPSRECTGAVISLDAIEPVVDEAIELGANLVIAHHPIVFSGLKSITGSNYIERTVIKAIKHDVALYAIHTNLDNVAEGVNRRIADKLGLLDTRILAPKKGMLRKLFTYIPLDHTDAVLQAVFEAGGGHIGNYSECSFRVEGTGTFKGGAGSDPFVGKSGERHAETEMKAEIIYPFDREGAVLKALKAVHPYEEVAYEIIALENEYQDVGSGMIGRLEQPMEAMKFLQWLKKTMQTDCIRYTDICKKEVSAVALCGGAGSFLLPRAIAAGADVFITGDFKYHQFFDADGRIIIADIGHYESEQFTSALIYDLLSHKIGNFALHLSKVDTNPVNYI